MKKLSIAMFALMLVFSASFANAFGSHKGSLKIHKMIIEEMLAAGAITQEELDAQKAEIMALRDMIKALREAGDKEGARALYADLKKAYRAKSMAVRKYLMENEELRAKIKASIREMRSKHKKSREDRRADSADKYAELKAKREAKRAEWAAANPEKAAKLAERRAKYMERRKAKRAAWKAKMKKKKEEKEAA